MTDLISDPEPLSPEYIPREFVDREETKAEIGQLLNPETARNIHLQGSRGTGKTHLLKSTLKQLPGKANTCFVDCRTCQTQYKALKQILRTITQEPVNDGHHTSDLQRKIEERTGAIPTYIVLDELDFLLQNDGDSLLYYLSRIEKSEQINIATVSSQTQELREQVEERTLSSLQPHTIQIEPYTGEETFQILLERAQKALKPQSLQQSALTYIASTTQNLKAGLTWLKIAAENSNGAITEQKVKENREDTREAYSQHLLDRFTTHHELLYQAITELTKEKGNPVKTGEVTSRYQELCNSYSEDSLSNRRISTYLKHLELLQLIQSEYHYGGTTGKTRKIRLIELCTA